MAEEKPAAAQCGGCAAPLPWAALLGRGVLMFETAETRDLCARCTLDYYYRTGGLGSGSGAGGSGRSTAGHATSPFPFAAAAAAAATAPPTAEEEEKKDPSSSRCAAACRKKVGLLGFACRCGGTFCAAHRHAESHGCGGFDGRRGVACCRSRKRIASENSPAVVSGE